eukprot:CAMPEP_0115374424 /NCGR_PEP_ID=MMETSP0271-20121206/1947_1 /TAXON_ID=71861 /ORGANISM="Scrippsiella trochoidea, Strain CCMP3099" /LENGTH=362 /DNA_ID=CAMNT_0002797471 /DNA_START=8 /DNA_END=1092 /DNA_ORIENTATION=+
MTARTLTCLCLLLVLPALLGSAPDELEGQCPASTGPPGLAMRFSDGRDFDVIDDVLEPDVLEALRTRLLNDRPRITANNGYGTTWLELDRVGAHHARTPIERIIRQYAKVAVGVDRGGGDYLGVDYWVQNRVAQNPKEYHADTDTSRCIEAQQTGDECDAALLSSVFYISSGGAGPTVIFNQSFNKFGLQPRMPTEVVVVPARTNRLVVFKGSYYHGVVMPFSSQGLAEHGGGADKRITLLANFWSKKPEEAHQKASLLESDPDSLKVLATRLGPDYASGHTKGCVGLAGIGQQARLVDAATTKIGAPFDGAGIDDWIKQRIPSKVVRKLKKATSRMQERWWEAPVVLKYDTSGVETQIPKT